MSSRPTRREGGAAARFAVLALIAAATVIAVIAPPPGPGTTPASPRITGEIQYFTLARNPRAVPAVGFRTGEGKTIGFAAFRGKVVVLNFWATWCVPCIREMPSLARLAARLKGAPAAVVALNEDIQGAARAAPFLARLGLDDLPLYLDPKGEVQRAFAVTSLPTTIIIDRAGREVGRLEGPADWATPEAEALVRHFIAGRRRR